MNLSLLIQLCGLPLLVVILTVAATLSVAAWFLAFKVRSEELLRAFFPLTALPVLAALFVVFTGTLSSIGLQLNADTDISVDSGFMLQVNLVPVLFALIASIPAAMITAGGRWKIAWEASGLRLLPEKQEEPETEVITPEQRMASDAEDYLQQIVRPR